MTKITRERQVPARARESIAWMLRRDPAQPLAGGAVGETLLKSLLAALLAVGGAWILFNTSVAAQFASASSLGRAAFLLPFMLLSAVLYFTLIKILKVPDADRAFDLLRRRLKRG